MEATTLTVECIVNAPVQRVWSCWTQPEHITQWNNASEDWYTPKAENDLRAGGRFLSRMEARDGSFGFDFTGVYTEVQVHQLIAYSLEDGRKVQVRFEDLGNTTRITEIFDPEQENSAEMQRTGWQAILNNFKRYTESMG